MAGSMDHSGRLTLDRHDLNPRVRTLEVSFGSSALDEGTPTPATNPATPPPQDETPCISKPRLHVAPDLFGEVAEHLLPAPPALPLPLDEPPSHLHLAKACARLAELAVAAHLDPSSALLRSRYRGACAVLLRQLAAICPATANSLARTGRA